MTLSNFTALGNVTSIETDHTHWWIGLLELFVFIFGVPLNLAVFYLVYTSRKRRMVPHAHKRRITEMFVMSMSSADLLFCAVHAPMMFMIFNQEISLGSVPCLTLFAVTHASTVASSLSLLWLNFNKFLHLHRPLHVFITRIRAVLFIGIGWLASISWGLFFVLGPFISYDSQCNIYLHHKSVYVIFATVFFVLPTLISLVISVYVAVVVVESNTGNSQKYVPHYHNRRFQGGSRDETGDKPGTGPLIAGPPAIRKSDQSQVCRVHFANENNNVHSTKPSPSLPDRVYQRRRAFSPTSWPPPAAFRAISPSARQLAHIRRISFVFTTTIWSTITVLPYRVAFIVKSLPKQEPTPGEEVFSESSTVATLAYFCLFAIMTVNAAGNPLITILTQRQYSSCIKEIWQEITGQKKSPNRTVGNDGEVPPYRGSLPRASADSAKLEILRLAVKNTSGASARSSINSQLSDR